MPDEKVEVIVTPDEPADKSVELSAEPKEAPAQKQGESNQQYLDRLQSTESQLKAIGNKAYGNERLLQGIQKQMSDIQATLKAQPAPTGDFWSDVDPRAKAEVERLVQAEAQKLFEAKEVERTVLQQRQNAEVRMQANLDKAFTRYPDLKDDNSEATGLWVQIANAHPEWNGDPNWPILLMAEMEELAPTHGVTLKPARSTPKTTTNGKGSSAYLPPSRQAISSNRIVVTQDENRFLEKHRIDPKSYKDAQTAIDFEGAMEL